MSEKFPNEDGIKTSVNMIEIESKITHPSTNQIILYKIDGNLHGCLKYINPVKEEINQDANTYKNFEKKVQIAKHVHFLTD